jgi:hypothetical protein
MKTSLTYLLGCLTAVISLCLVSCGDDDDYGRGYPYYPNHDDQPVTPVNNTIEGQWKGSLKVKCYVFGRVFTSDEEYIRIIPDKNNKTIGTGEMICFYDDETCPLKAESMYFTWYEKDGELVVSVPCDKNLDCTVANWSVSGGKLSGVIKGNTFSDVLSLSPLTDYDEWNLYFEDSKYGVYYRDQAVKGEWTGDLAFSYTENDVVYKAKANIRFVPKDQKGMSGTGEEIEYYERPCPIHYESLYFTWEMVNGVLELTYPFDESMNMDIYQILQTEDTFEALVNDDNECHLTKLVGYKDWGLFDVTKGYAIAYYDDMPLPPTLLRAAAAAGRVGHRSVGSAAQSKGATTRRVGKQ